MIHHNHRQLNRQQTPAGTRILFGKTAGSGTSESYVVYYSQNTLWATIGDIFSIGDQLSYPWVPAPSTWHHIAFTYDDPSGAQALYVDGDQVASSVTTRQIGYDAHPVIIGAEYENEQVVTFFQGGIDEVSLYSRSLASDEIAAISGAGTAGKCKIGAGLIAYYPFDGNAADLSGNGRDGTEHGVTYVPSPSGLAASFAGSPQYISLPSSITLATDLTFAFWMNASVSDSDAWPFGTFLLSRDICGATYDWSVCVGNGQKLQFQTGAPDANDGNTLLSTTDVSNGNWVHIAVVVDSATATKRLYVNGQLNASVAWSPVTYGNNGLDIFVGASTCKPDTHDYFVGLIDDLYLYDRALSDPEIQDLFRQQ